MTLDETLNPNVDFYPINVYHLRNNDVPNQVKDIMMQYEDNNKTKCIVTFGEPTSYEYQKIKLLKEE